MKKLAMVGRVFFIASTVALALSLNACTEPGETTAIGATAGGVLGAGLGAIVGNQTGNAGSGLVIGAVAGAGTGAMVANALQAQDETIRAQDEAIERQEQVLRSQKSEIEELRRMNQAGESLSPAKKQQSLRSVRNDYAREMPRRTPNDQEIAAARYEAFEASPNSGIQEKDLESRQQSLNNLAIQNSEPAAQRASYNWAKGSSAIETKTFDTKKLNMLDSAECTQAQAEVSKAHASTESADKLFHLRRALRLCPDHSGYHNDLGELYLSLNRKDDAAFEFGEALRLDPDNRQARANLGFMKKK